MKRFVAIILMCLLAANVGGFSITRHWCGKKSQYVSFSGKKKDHSCCCKGGIKDRGCCKTKYAKLKLDKCKHVSKQIQQHQQLIADVLPQSVEIPAKTVRFVATTDVIPRIHPPPLISHVRKHVLLGIFLI